MLRQLRSQLKQWAISQLLLETGVRIDPEPGVWGILEKNEEDIVLARLYNDKLFIALLRKYAEGANKALLARVSMDQEYWKLRGQFFCYNSMILKSRRANIKLKASGQTFEQDRT